MVSLLQFCSYLFPLQPTISKHLPISFTFLFKLLLYQLLRIVYIFILFLCGLFIHLATSSRVCTSRISTTSFFLFVSLCLPLITMSVVWSPERQGFFDIVFLCGLAYLGWFGDDSGCEFLRCSNDREVLDVDDRMSQSTLDEARPLNLSRDVLVFLHIQKTVPIASLTTIIINSVILYPAQFAQVRFDTRNQS